MMMTTRPGEESVSVIPVDKPTVEQALTDSNKMSVSGTGSVSVRRNAVVAMVIVPSVTMTMARRTSDSGTVRR